MRTRFLLPCVVLLGLAAMAAPSHAQRGVRVEGQAAGERRVALVIGNANYDPSVGKLVNPAHDAEDMAGALGRLGFQVTLKRDVDKREFEAAVDAFRATVRDASVALFFFAGHGVQVDNANYLVPLHARLHTQTDAKYEGVNASWVVDAMQDGGAKASIVILDACRNNPLPKAGRGAGGGLAAMQASGALIAFAAGSGQTADENAGGRNGLYTRELLKNLRAPGVSIVDVFQKTREGVAQASGKRQIPQDWNQLLGTVVLLPGSGGAPQPSPAVTPALDPAAEAWSLVKESTRPDDFADFARAFPDSPLAATARFREGQLRRAATPAPALAPAPAVAAGGSQGISSNLTAQEWFNKGLAAKDPQQQVQFYSESLRLSPEWAPTYHNRGTAYYELKQYQRAIEDYDQALRLKPDYTSAYYNRANAYVALKQYQRAIEDYDQALRLKSDYSDAYYGRGASYGALKQYQRAIEDYDQALRLNPNSVIAYEARGHAYSALQQYQHAIEDFGQVLRLKPDHAAAYYSRAFAYRALKQYQQAIPDLDQALRLKPDDAIAYAIRGSTNLALKQYQRAIGDFDQALRLKQDYAVAYNDRGGAYYGLGQRVRSYQDFRKACELGLQSTCDWLKQYPE